MAPLSTRDPTYGGARRGWAARVAAGGVVCWLCNREIVGAFDLDRARGAGVLAPTHPGCNRAEGARWRGRRRLAWGSGTSAS
jgi:hypothetical protein